MGSVVERFVTGALTEARDGAIWVGGNAGLSRFDPATGRFTRAGVLPRPLSDAAVAVYGHRVWLLGGEDPTVTDGVLTISVR